MGDEEMGLSAIRNGASDYLIKNLPLDALLVRTIRHALKRKRAEDALRNSEARYKTLFSAAVEGILVADAQTKQFLYCNPAICRMLGYTEEELRHLSVGDIHPKEALGQVLAKFEAMVRGERKSIEVPCLRKDGTVFDVSIGGSGIVIDGRECLVGFFTDITERKQAENRLRESEDKFKTLYESSRDAIMITSPEKGFLHGNPAAIELFGCKDLEEFISKTPADLSPQYQPDGTASAVKAQQMMATAMKEGSHFFEWTHKRIDGTEFFATALLTKIELKGQAILQATVRGITDRKKAEGLITQAAREWQRTFDSISDLVFVQDKDFNILKVNKTFADAMKLKPEDIIGKKCYEVVHARNSPWPECPFKESKRDKEPHTKEVDDQNVGVPLLISISPVFDDKGEVIDSVHIAKDITASKKLEEQLLLNRASLYNIVEKSTDGVLVVDKDGIVKFINHAAEALFGRKSKTLVGEMFGFPVVGGEVMELGVLRQNKKLGTAEMRVVKTR